MSEKAQITFMQTRILRLASEEWHMPVLRVSELFSRWGIFHYIEACYGSFHCEGDEAVLEDITDLLERKGLNMHAAAV